MVFVLGIGVGVAIGFMAGYLAAALQPPPV